jgi:hypothetical protein
MRETRQLKKRIEGKVLHIVWDKLKRYERNTMMVAEVTVVEYLAAGITRSAQHSIWRSL